MHQIAPLQPFRRRHSSLKHENDCHTAQNLSILLLQSLFDFSYLHVRIEDNEIFVLCDDKNNLSVRDKLRFYISLFLLGC